jgi:hypothetical protein
VYATPEVREMPHTSRATPPTTPSHVRIRIMDRAACLRPAFLPEARFMRPHGSTPPHRPEQRIARRCGAAERVRPIRST